MKNGFGWEYTYSGPAYVRLTDRNGNPYAIRIQDIVEIAKASESDGTLIYTSNAGKRYAQQSFDDVWKALGREAT